MSLIYLFAGYRINLLFRGFKDILFALFALGWNVFISVYSCANLLSIFYQFLFFSLCCCNLLFDQTLRRTLWGYTLLALTLTFGFLFFWNLWLLLSLWNLNFRLRNNSLFVFIGLLGSNWYVILLRRRFLTRMRTVLFGIFLSRLHVLFWFAFRTDCVLFFVSFFLFGNLYFLIFLWLFLRRYWSLLASWRSWRLLSFTFLAVFLTLFALW